MTEQFLPFDQIPEVKPLSLIPETARFDGADCQAKRDNARLTSQIQKIFELMKDGKWRTFDEIHKATKAPHNSISAQLRNLRKPRFGEHKVESDYIGNGLYKYRLIVNE